MPEIYLKFSFYSNQIWHFWPHRFLTFYHVVAMTERLFCVLWENHMKIAGIIPKIIKNWIKPSFSVNHLLMKIIGFAFDFPIIKICTKLFRNFGTRKKVDKWHFSANLVEFRSEKGHSQFVTQCYIWAFFS